MPRWKEQMQDFYLAMAATRICAVFSTADAGKLLKPKTVLKLSVMKVMMN